LVELTEAHRVHAEVLARIGDDGTDDYTLLNEHFRADWAFHQVFFAHADNRYLRTMVENLSTYTHRMRQTWTGGPGTFDGHTAHLDGVRARSLNAVAERGEGDAGVDGDRVEAGSARS